MEGTNRGLRAKWRWSGAWLALCAIFYAVHITLWLHNHFVLAMEPLGWLIKPVGNLVHVLTLPGWLVARFTLNSWGESDLVASLLACAVGSAVIIAVARGAWMLRAKLIGKDDRPTTAPDAAEQPSTSSIAFSRRRLLADGLLLGTSVGATTIVVNAACLAPERLRLQRYTVAIRDLPAELEGLRFAQITDTHLGPRVPAELIDAALDLAMSLNPDAFLLTGDYVHCGLEWIDPATRQFSPLVATGKPVLAVLGNHDWFNSGATMARSLRDTGIDVIDNDRLFLSRTSSRECRIGRHAAANSICMAGLGDLRQDHINPDKALRDVAPEMARIVLAHNPDSAEERSVVRVGAPRIDLMISGHTHGGQVRLPGFGTGTGLMSKYGDKYSAGLVRGPACQVLISRGIGMSLVPFRFLVPPEVVEITLTRDDRSEQPARRAT